MSKIQGVPRDFLKNAMKNGIGRYVCQCKRITLRFCKEHGGSRHMREFVENHLLEFTQQNPGVVVYLQPRRHRAPSMVAEYLNGRRETMNLSGKAPAEICQWVEFMRTRQGCQIVELEKPHHTDNPSTQGIWHPFMFADTETAAVKFPNDLLSKIKPVAVGTTATEAILAEQQQAKKKGS